MFYVMCLASLSLYQYNGYTCSKNPQLPPLKQYSCGVGAQCSLDRREHKQSSLLSTDVYILCHRLHVFHFSRKGYIWFTSDFCERKHVKCVTNDLLQGFSWFDIIASDNLSDVRRQRPVQRSSFTEITDD